MILQKVDNSNRKERKLERFLASLKKYMSLCYETYTEIRNYDKKKREPRKEEYIFAQKAKLTSKSRYSVALQVRLLIGTVTLSENMLLLLKGNLGNTLTKERAITNTSENMTILLTGNLYSNNIVNAIQTNTSSVTIAELYFYRESTTSCNIQVLALKMTTGLLSQKMQCQTSNDEIMAHNLFQLKKERR